MGISEKDLPHIFEPFYSTKEAAKGTGLGLAVAYGIITAQRKNPVEETSPAGTTFKINLPLNTVSENEQQAKILIVDDEKIVRESLFHWFEEEGYIVDTAESGEAALKKFDKGKYDLLLLDMKMPGMSGLELLKKIKEIDPDAIVILITAFASVPTAITALKDGAYDYVTKPVDPDELAHLVRKAIEQKELKD